MKRQLATIVPIQEDPSTSTPPSPSPKSNKGSYWSWAFGFTMFPFVFWGCPFYLLLGNKVSQTFSTVRIVNTFYWLKAAFDCRSPAITFISVVLIIPTVIINGYVIFAIGDLLWSLFIIGKYKLSFINDAVELIRFLPIVLPLNYVWFRGFKVSNMITALNNIHRDYEGVGCGSHFRTKIICLVVIIVVVHIIRCICYDKYELSNSTSVWKGLKTIFDFSVVIFSTFLMPLYCTFCYAITFQLYVIKAFVYKLVSRRVPPNIHHLSCIKSLYTQAADTIMTVNGLFSAYMPISMLIMLIGVTFDAGTLWKVLALISHLTNSCELLEEEDKTGEEECETLAEIMTPAVVREINAEIACIFIIYGMVVFTVLQAIDTNDCARELNVWLNDFVTGAGGTDVTGILASLGALNGPGKCGVKMKDDNEILYGYLYEDTGQTPLIWAHSAMQESGMDDEFLRKFRNLKAYIHSRMQLEDPALLRLIFVGILTPTLPGRLLNYRVTS